MWLAAVSIKKKKKEFILLQNVLFFLSSLCGHLRRSLWQWVWLSVAVSGTFLSFLSVLCGIEAADSDIGVGQHRFDSPHRKKALGGTQEGTRCFRILPLLPHGTFGLAFCLVSKKGGIVTWGLCSLPGAKELLYAAFILFFYFWLRLAVRTEQLQLFFFF